MHENFEILKVQVNGPFTKERGEQIENRDPARTSLDYHIFDVNRDAFRLDLKVGQKDLGPEVFSDA